MVFILASEQSPLIKKGLKKILKDRLGEPDDFNVVRFDLTENSEDEIIDEFSMLPLGYERKAVIVDNAAFLSGGNKARMEKFADKMVNDDTVDIIFIVRSETLDEKSPVFNFAKENGQVLLFKNISKDDWPKYVKKYFTDKGVKITDQAVFELINRVGNDLNRFQNEANKLCLYKDSIDLVDITLMVSKPLDDNVFNLTNALFRRDNALALSIFRDMKLLGAKNIDPLIPMLASQFRFINEALFLAKKGFSVSEIAHELDAKEFRVKKALENARRLPKGTIPHALSDLYFLDYRIKNGLIDRFYGIELFLINFPN